MAQQPFGVDVGISIQDDVGQSNVLRGEADPSQAPGRAAPISSLYLRAFAGGAQTFKKNGPADTDWEELTGASASGLIGEAEDGTYEDGLFQDFVPSTPVGTAVDRFNEVLAALAPAQAPELESITMQNGVSAILSFGASNGIVGYSNVDGAGNCPVSDINAAFPVSDNRYGVFLNPANITGTLANGVPAHDYAYPANAFGPGNSGLLNLLVNGIQVCSVDLSSAGSGNFVGPNGSRFTLSAATPVQFQSGVPFPAFQYRTGTFIVAALDMRPGYNYVQVIHDVGGVETETNFVNFVRDEDVTAMTAPSEVLDALVQTGLRYLSGVQYYSAGSAQYDCVVNNVHRNVYGAGNVVTFPTTNGSASARSLLPISEETDPVIITDAAVTIATGSRLLNGTVTTKVQITHPLKSTVLSPGSSIPGLWIDAIATADTLVVHNFCTEQNRLMNRSAGGVNNYQLQANIAAGDWDPTESIISGPAGYADGLLCYSGACRYPLQGFDGGDFRNQTDGNANGALYGPAGQPNYNAASGIREYTFFFENNSGITRANWKIRFEGTGSFQSNDSEPSGNNFCILIKFPDGSISAGTGWMDAYKDFATNQWGDAAGIRNATLGSGRAMNTDWGMTVGTKSIAAGEKIVVVIRAAASHTGNISKATLTWL